MNKQKKLMLLGGIRYLIPIIEKAHELGAYVITADYLPNNIAHKYSDEYCNVSIVDKNAVLKEAERLQIDGILSFACDPGVVTAAYVAEKMGLPFQGPYKSVCILQDKGLFRKFLLEHGFNAPHAKSYIDKKKPFDDVDYFDWPVIVKPVDSAGSKGVTKVERIEDLESAIDYALGSSISGAFIIEDFITIQGYRSSADPFTIDGKLVYNFYSDQQFDKTANNPYIPDKIIYPSTMLQSDQDYLSAELERLFALLGMKDGIYNIEACVGENGKPYIMEVSPRGGGNSIAEEQRMAYGVDLAENEVRRALGMPLLKFNLGNCDGVWCNYAIHSRNGVVGKYKDLWIDPIVKKNNVKYLGLTISRGDNVKPFVGANDCLGDMFLRFENKEEMDRMMEHVDEWLRIIVE